MPIRWLKLKPTTLHEFRGGSAPKTKKPHLVNGAFCFYLVGRAGLEPAPNGLKVIFVLQKYSFINSV
jgi:hypothetical protein